MRYGTAMSPQLAGRLAAVMTACLWAGSATASPPDQGACLEAFGDAQDRREAGELLAAREALRLCAEAACPDVVEQKCVQWLGEVEAEIPSLVVVLPAGVSAEGLTVLVDGVERPDALSGRPVELEPGPHELEHRRDGVSLGTVPVVLAQGERNKRVELTVEATTPALTSPPPPAPLPATEESVGISPWLWVGGGVTLVGVVVGAVTGGMALSRASDLDEQCPGGRCPESARSDFDTGQTLSHVSTAGFVVAGVGAVMATVGIVLSLDGDADTAQLHLGPSAARLRVSF